MAALLNVSKSEVVFTSGSTESTNIAIQGLYEYSELSGKKHIITTAIEHKAVLNTVKYLGNHGFDVEFVNPDLSGRISVDDVLNRVRKDTLLVSVMHVNNETGIIQPIEKLGEALGHSGILFHIDATQSCGKLVKEIKNLKYDMLSLSAHKFGGPQGIGALILRKKNYKYPPVKNVYFGGSQEQGFRPGTIPVALVAGLGKACQIANEEYVKQSEENREIKDVLLKLLNQSGVRYQINGDPQFSVDNTLSVYFEGVSSEALMIATKKYCAISNGSACNSNSYELSYVLKAMGLPPERIESSIRISWGPSNNREEIRQAFMKLLDVAREMSI